MRQKWNFFRFFDSECEAKWNFVCFCESEWSFCIFCESECETKLNFVCFVRMSVRQSGIVRFVPVNSLKSGDS